MGNIIQNMDIVAKKYKEEEKQKEELFKKDSKEKLKKIIASKMKTSFIGSLSAIEQAFGELWGLDDDVQLNGSQLKWKKVWENCRTIILNNGNSQLRAIDSELKNYQVIFNKCQKFIIMEDSDGSQ